MRIGNFELGEEVNRSGTATVYRIAAEPRPTVPRVVKSLAEHAFWTAPQRHARVRAFFAGVLAQKAAATTGAHWAPIHADGLATTRAFYVTRRYACSAAALCSPGAPAIPLPTLHRIISGVLAGLVELRSAAGRPHGRLTPNNILLDRPHSHRPTVVLTDPAPDVGPGSESLNVQADLRAVGELICQFVLHAPVPREAVVPAEDPAWQALGTTGRAWRTFAARLLGGAEPFNAPEEARRNIPRLPAPAAAKFAAAAILLAAAALASFFYVHPPGGRGFNQQEWATLCGQYTRYEPQSGQGEKSLADDAELAPLLRELRAYDPRGIARRNAPGAINDDLATLPARPGDAKIRPGPDDTHTALRFITEVVDPALRRRADQLSAEFDLRAGESLASYRADGALLAARLRASPPDSSNPVRQMVDMRRALSRLDSAVSDLRISEAAAATLAHARDPLAELVRDETARVVGSHDPDQVGRWARRIEAADIAKKLTSGYDVKGFEQKWTLLFPKVNRKVEDVLNTWVSTVEQYRYLSNEEDPRKAVEDELGTDRTLIERLPRGEAIFGRAMKNWMNASQVIASSRRDLPNPIQRDAPVLRELARGERDAINRVIDRYGKRPSNQQELQAWAQSIPPPSDDDDAINRSWTVASKKVFGSGHPLHEQYDLLRMLHDRLTDLNAKFKSVDTAVPFPDSKWQNDAVNRSAAVKAALEKAPLDRLSDPHPSNPDGLGGEAAEKYRQWRSRMATVLAGADLVDRVTDNLFDPDEPLSPSDPRTFAEVYAAWKQDLAQCDKDDQSIFKEVDGNAQAVVGAANVPTDVPKVQTLSPVSALAAAWKRSSPLPPAEGQIERQLTTYVANIPGPRRDVLLQRIASVRRQRLIDWLDRPTSRSLAFAGAFSAPQDVVRSARDCILVPFHVDPRELPATCRYNLALLGLREKLASTDRLKNDDVRNWPELADVIHAGQEDELRGKLVNFVATAKGILSPGHKESEFPGPDFAGWKRRDGMPGQILFQSPAPEPVTLEFWRIGQNSQTYLCSTVVSIKAFRAVAAELDENELKGLKARFADDGVGKPGACALDYVNDKWVAREKWFIPTEPEPLEPERSYKGLPPDGPPTPEHPVQLVSAKLAKLWSNRLKCRLPTIKEWTAALEVEQKGAGRGELNWNVRDKCLADYRSELKGTWLKRFPRDKHLFPSDAVQFMSELGQLEIDKHCTNPTYNDGHVFIEPVQPKPNDGAGNVGIHFFHLIGNVAQFVTETSGGDHVCVIGGSAFWKNPSYTTPYEVPADKLDDGWVDVGFRLAFDEGAPIREQLRTLVAGASFIDAPATVLPH